MTDRKQDCTGPTAGASFPAAALPGCNGVLFGFVQVLPGFGAAAYAKVVEALGPEPLAGLVAHLAGPCADGWRIVQVWRSAADHARFERERLLPALADTGAFGATSGAPLVEMIEVSHVMLGAIPVTICSDR